MTIMCRRQRKSSVSYGQLACQEPNENTVFFIKDMMDEQHKNQADALADLL